MSGTPCRRGLNPGIRGPPDGRPRLGPGQIGELWTSPKKNSKELYEARLPYVDWSGIRRQCRVARPTKGQARAEVLARVEKLLGDVEQPSARATVERVVSDWLASRPSKQADVRRGISPQTRAGYSEVIRQAIVPGLGAVPLEALTAGSTFSTVPQNVR